MAKRKDFAQKPLIYKALFSGSPTIAKPFKSIKIPSRPAFPIMTLFSEKSFGFDYLASKGWKPIIKHDRYDLVEVSGELKYFDACKPYNDHHIETASEMWNRFRSEINLLLRDVV